MARTLKVEIIGDSSSLERAFGKVGGASSKLGGSLRTLGKVAAVGVGAAFAGMAATIADGLNEIADSQKVAAQTAAVLKSTGASANVTAKQVDDLATSLSNVSGIDDEVIGAGENMLLTFTNIRNEVGKGNDIFNQSTEILTDMSVALGTDMSKSAIQLGKALNDPVKGVSALARVGVTFTEGQKNTIKSLVDSGKTMEAQKLILAELNKEFGGSAKAAGETLPGQLAKMRNAFDDVAGQVASVFVPVLAKGLGAVSGFLQDFGKAKGFRAKLNVVWEGVRDVAVALFNQLRDAFNAIDWAAVWKNITNTFKRIGDAFSAIDWGAVGKTISAGITKALEFLGSIDYAGILSNVLTKIFNAFTTLVNSIDWNALGRQIGAFIVTALNGLASFIERTDWNKVGQALVAGFKQALIALGTFLAGVDWLAVIGALVRGLVAVLKGLTGLLLGIVIGLGKALIQGIAQGLTAAWPSIKSWFAALPGKILSLLGSAGSWLVHKGVEVLEGFAKGYVSAWAKLASWWLSLPGKILAALGNLGSVLYSAGVALIQGLWDGVSSKVSGFFSYLGGLASKAKSIFTLGLHGSPELFTYYLGGQLMTDMAKGVVEKQATAQKAMYDAAKKAVDAAKQAVVDSKGIFTSAFDELTSTALAAFDKLSQDFETRTEKKIRKQDEARAKADRQRALDEANAAIQAAQAALQTPVTQKEGESPEDFAARQAEAVKQATDALITAQQQQADAIFAIQRANDEKRAAQERKARDDSRELQRRHFQEQLATLEKQLENGRISAEQFRNRVHALFDKFGVPFRNAGQVLGSALAEGLQDSFKDATRAAGRLIEAIANEIAKAKFVVSVQVNVKGGNPPGRQHGGPVRRGSPYIVGEAGPELFVPASSGRIATATATAGGAGMSAEIHIPVYLNGTQITEVVRRELLRFEKRNGRAAL